nr:uncharacterized protein LOC109150395 [Ipomoea batatas]
MPIQGRDIELVHIMEVMGIVGIEWIDSNVSERVSKIIRGLLKRLDKKDNEIQRLQTVIEKDNGVIKKMKLESKFQFCYGFTIGIVVALVCLKVWGNTAINYEQKQIFHGDKTEERMRRESLRGSWPWKFHLLHWGQAKPLATATLGVRWQRDASEASATPLLLPRLLTSSAARIARPSDVGKKGGTALLYVVSDTSL